jgi:probable O-glycosylation ligase (exosortase A-associated)
MSDFFIAFVMIAFFVVGISRPAVAYAGYVWVDVITPQNIMFGFLSGQPISMIMAAFLFVTLLFNANKVAAPKSILVFALIVLFCMWITITTYTIALFPGPATYKWDWAIKSIFMTSLGMFVIRDRRDLEIFLWVLFFSFSFYVISVGAKTALGGGGYGKKLVAGGNNSGWTESSMLALTVLIVIPLNKHLQEHYSFFPPFFKKKVLWYGLSLLSLFAMIGTTARSGLITIAGYIGYRNFSLVRLLFFVPILVGIAILSVGFLPAEWVERMMTLKNVEGDSSAMGRVVVWMWTFDFVSSNWLGGGFDSYRANAGILGEYHESFQSYIGAKAFHNSFIEVLGEQGFIGLFLYVLILFQAYRLNKEVLKKTKPSDYHYSLAYCLNSMLVMYCCTAMFIGVAYQPLPFIIVTLCVVNHSVWLREMQTNETHISMSKVPLNKRKRVASMQHRNNPHN